MQVTVFTRKKIRETFTHFFNMMHLSVYQISLVDTEGGVAHILSDQYRQIDYLKNISSLSDKNMSSWLDKQVKFRIESEIKSVA